MCRPDSVTDDLSGKKFTKLLQFLPGHYSSALVKYEQYNADDISLMYDIALLNYIRSFQMLLYLICMLCLTLFRIDNCNIANFLPAILQ